MFKDSDAVDSSCQKFKQKVTCGTEEIHIADDAQHAAVTGAITAAYLNCRDQLETYRQASAAPPNSSAPPYSYTCSCTHAQSGRQGPKNMASRREYQSLIKQYHEHSGKTRHFPEKTVLGADKILVRMWREHHKSKNYTAVTLGEIITNRTFTATGTVSSTVKRDRLDKTLTIDNANN